jgi:hypothetical protein
VTIQTLISQARATGDWQPVLDALAIRLVPRCISASSSGLVGSGS